MFSTSRPILPPNAGSSHPSAQPRPRRRLSLIADSVIRDTSAASGRPGCRKAREVVELAAAGSCAGLVDMRAFVGDAGRRIPRDLRVASLAAAAGGVTTIACRSEHQARRSDEPAMWIRAAPRPATSAMVHVHPMADPDQGHQGHEMTRDRSSSRPPAPSPSFFTERREKRHQMRK